MGILHSLRLVFGKGGDVHLSGSCLLCRGWGHVWFFSGYLGRGVVFVIQDWWCRVDVLRIFQGSP